MCNAWNHWPGCDCGWGGGLHGSGSGSSLKSQAPTISFAVAKVRFSTYVNPNARCPVCNALVYFYQSPDGGRVFFDELGPPWPKHPCTDLRIKPETSFRLGRYILNRSIPKWQAEGWIPAMLLFNGNSISRYSVCFEILGATHGRFVDCMMYNDFAQNLEGPNVIIYFRSISDSEFEVMAYNIKTDQIDRCIFQYAHPAIKRT